MPERPEHHHSSAVIEIPVWDDEPDVFCTEIDNVTKIGMPDVFAVEPDGLAESRQVERDHVLLAGAQIAGILIDHGAAPQDVPRLMPKARRIRDAMRRQRIAVQDAMLAADDTVCDMPRRGCPAHGDTHLRWTRRRDWRCDTEGCRFRLREGMYLRHCDQPAAALVEYGGGTAREHTGFRCRLCTGHLASENEAAATRQLPPLRILDTDTPASPPDDGGGDGGNAA